MPILIPDTVFVDTINLTLDAFRSDYNNKTNDSQTLLYLIFGGTAVGNYDFYQNVKSLIITTPENPKHLIAKSSLDHTTSQSPAIFVILPSENDRNNSLQQGIGDQEESSFGFTDPDVQDTYRNNLMKRYATVYQVIVLTENRNELLVLYNLVKAIIQMCISHLEMSGISNLKIGGGDIKLDQSVPQRFFTRAVTLGFEYEQVVPEIDINLIFRNISLFWKPEGATVASGPIEFSTDDDLNSDSQSS